MQLERRYRKIEWPLLVQRAGFWLVAALLILYAAWPWLPGVGAEPQRTVVVYGFSIFGEVMDDGVFPAFQQEWEARTGERVELVSSFAG